MPKTNRGRLDSLANRLPNDLVKEVTDFAAFLEKRHRNNINNSKTNNNTDSKGEYLKGDWIGSLRDLGEKGITGLKLQKEATRTRIKNALDYEISP